MTTDELVSAVMNLHDAWTGERPLWRQVSSSKPHAQKFFDALPEEDKRKMAEAILSNNGHEWLI